MAISRRHTGTLFLQLIFLPVLAFPGTGHFSHMLQNDGAAISLFLSHYSDGLTIECPDLDEDTVDSYDARSPEYSPQSVVPLPSLNLEAGRRYLPTPNHYLPIVYLPIFSPPKIRA